MLISTTLAVARDSLDVYCKLLKNSAIKKLSTVSYLSYQFVTCFQEYFVYRFNASEAMHQTGKYSYNGMIFNNKPVSENHLKDSYRLT